jgi:hypothetical protein
MNHLPEHSPHRSAVTPVGAREGAGGTQALRDRDRNRAVSLPRGPGPAQAMPHDHLPAQHVTLAGSSQGGKAVFQPHLRGLPRARPTGCRPNGDRGGA